VAESMSAVPMTVLQTDSIMIWQSQGMRIITGAWETTAEAVANHLCFRVKTKTNFAYNSGT